MQESTSERVISPGALRCNLVLEAPVLNDDEGGGEQISWLSVGNHWAHVHTASGSEVYRASQQAQNVTHRVTVRASSNGSSLRPRAHQRFRVGSRILSIRAVFERDNKNRYLTCLCEEYST